MMRCQIHDARDSRGTCSCSEIVKVLRANTLSEESQERVRQAVALTRQAFEGATKEEMAAFLCAISAESGFYDEAIQFAEFAKTHRDAIVRAGGR